MIVWQYSHKYITPDKASSFFNQKLDIFPFLHENIMLWNSVEAPQQGASNEYP